MLNEENKIRSRLSRWVAGDHASLWIEAVNSRKSKPTVQRSTSVMPNTSKVKRALQLGHEGKFRKCLNTLTSLGVNNSEEAYKSLLAKHPQSELPCIPVTDVIPAPPKISSETLLACLRSFPKDTGSGASNTKVTHLLQAVECPAPEHATAALVAITALANTLVAGMACQEIAPYLCGAPLLAINKKNNDVRPIAVGEILRRLVAKCLCSHTKAKANSFLAPLQLGVGVRGACEAIVHAFNSLVESLSPSCNPIAILLIDISNAFNSVNRSRLLSEVARHFPELLPWVKFCYAQPSHLLFGDKRILSSSGIQQGDPLSTLLFSLTIHPVLSRLAEKYSSLAANVWYLDDGSVAGDPSMLCSYLRDFVRAVEEIDLKVNFSKCEVWAPHGADLSIFPPEVSRRRHGLEILGAPISLSGEFSNEVVSNRVFKAITVINKLHELEDPQLELTLLRTCVGIPKIMFCLRTVDPDKATQSLNTFDSCLNSALENIIGKPLSDASRLEAALPIKSGGLGIPTCSHIGPSAHVGSYLDCQPLVKALVQNALPPKSILQQVVKYNAQTVQDFKLDAVGPLQNHNQKFLTDKANAALANSLLSSAVSTRNKARLLSLKLPFNGDWLKCIPIKSLGLTMSPVQFRLALQYRMGQPIFDSTTKNCPSCPSGKLDSFGDHAVQCAGEGDRINRHNILRNTVFDMARKAGLSPVLEKKNLLDQSSSKPGDIYLPHWSRGVQAALDVTVVSSLQSKLVDAASLTPGAALISAEDAKCRKYEEACSHANINLIPLAVEALGGWSATAVSNLFKIAKLAADRSGKCGISLSSHFMQQLSISLQKWNSSMIASRLRISSF